MTRYRIENPLDYIHHLEGWLDSLPPGNLAEIAASPAHCAVLSVDMIKGFCSMGPLSSPLVASIIQPIVSLMERAWNRGIHHIIFLQDTHEPDAVEFSAFPPHCVRGSEEAETVPELKALPFFDQGLIFEKNSISSGIHTDLNEWLASHPDVGTFIVVGNCTDLCTYQLAMHLRLDANARQQNRRVIIPADCAATYDLPVKQAEEIGAVAHPASFLNAVFLHNMHLNGIEIDSTIH